MPIGRKSQNMLQLWFVANTVLWRFSISPGGVTLRLNIVLLILAGLFQFGKTWKISISSVKVLLVFLIFSIFSFVVALTGPCTDYFQKSILATLILVSLVFIGLEVGRWSDSSDWLRLQKTALWIIALTFSTFIVELFAPALFPADAGYRAKGELSGLFDEPSQVAFSLFPCIVLLLVSDEKKTRRIGLLALAGLFIFSRSSTLIMFAACWFLYRLFVQMSARKVVILLLNVVLLIGICSLINFDAIFSPTIDRVMGVIRTDALEGTNLSSLIYIQGWQDAWDNIARTHGLGLGFNMMGCSPLPNVSVRSILALRGVERLNADDGSFLFAKVLSETGLVAIIFYVAATIWWLRLELKIRLHRKYRDSLAATMQSALIFFFLISSFIRSPGYFGGTALLWLVAVRSASKWLKQAYSEAGWKKQVSL